MDAYEDQEEEIEIEEDTTCPSCGIRQYGDVCKSCGTQIKEENEKEKTMDDDDEYDRRERR
jgi:tRNA(Ile2) C34 agmatinyltransferase TiaS